MKNLIIVNNSISRIRDTLNRIESQSYLLRNKDLKEAFNNIKLELSKLNRLLTNTERSRLRLLKESKLKEKTK